MTFEFNSINYLALVCADMDVYFKDPDGTQLEFAAWARELTHKDVSYQAC